MGSHTINNAGKIVENIINLHDLNILNDGSMTHFSVAYGTFSAIDIAILSPALQFILSGKCTLIYAVVTTFQSLFLMYKNR